MTLTAVGPQGTQSKDTQAKIHRRQDMTVSHVQYSEQVKTPTFSPARPNDPLRTANDLFQNVYNSRSTNSSDPTTTTPRPNEPTYTSYIILFHPGPFIQSIPNDYGSNKMTVTAVVASRGIQKKDTQYKIHRRSENTVSHVPYAEQVKNPTSSSARQTYPLTHGQRSIPKSLTTAGPRTPTTLTPLQIGTASLRTHLISYHFISDH